MTVVIISVMASGSPSSLSSLPALSCRRFLGRHQWGALKDGQRERRTVVLRGLGETDVNVVMVAEARG
jgi:hypothetical protein